MSLRISRVLELTVCVAEVLLLLQEPSLIEMGKSLSEGLLAQTTSWCKSLKAGKLSSRSDDHECTSLTSISV